VLLSVKPRGTTRAIPLHQPKNTTVGYEAVGIPLGSTVDVLYTPAGGENHGYEIKFECSKQSVSSAGEPGSAIVAGRPAINISSDADGAGRLGVASIRM